MSIYLRMEPSIKDKKNKMLIQKVYVKDMEFKYGLMEGNTRVIGEIIKLKAEVNFIMLMVMCMMVIGQMIKQMDTVFIFMLMALNMRVNG